MTITHAKVSAVADGTDASKVRPSDWNAAHSLSLPYGCFSDSTTQAAASITTAYKVALNTDEYKSGITHSTSVNNSRVTIPTAGTYLITFSAILASVESGKHIEFWLAVDGTNVPRSGTMNHMVASSSERIVTVTFLYKFTAGQYFELVWCAPDTTQATLVAAGVGASPTRPASPSIIVTVNMMSGD
jgi:hypothetical protein